ncbi:MAG: tetraacyldisaccharide 4'-kinase [Campylobacterota bacterium]|nr:tetraacyldisaccharide 4'-kinase [Campylobacterota bacterium]
MKAFFEKLFFEPKWYHWAVSIVLLPLSVVYGGYMCLRRLLRAKTRFTIPIVSVGNMIVGGSGKTPFVIALASRYDDVFVISRGYGRQTQGIMQVSSKGKILTSVTQSGDEAMMMAHALKNASVIVCEKRDIAIELAMREGAKLIILDDGFNRVEIEKYEVLLEPKNIQNYLPFPSGPFRGFWFEKRHADLVLKEGEDFTREVSYRNLQDRMLLVTAISNPKRLEPYLPKGIVAKKVYDDHAYFKEEELNASMQEYEVKSLLVTEKDAVKMEEFQLPLSKMQLKLHIENEVFEEIENYIKGYRDER